MFQEADTMPFCEWRPNEARSSDCEGRLIFAIARSILSRGENIFDAIHHQVDGDRENEQSKNAV